MAVDRPNLLRYVQYIVNTGQRPLPIAFFDDDWEPVGPMVRRDLLAAGWVKAIEGGLAVTEAGLAALEASNAG